VGEAIVRCWDEELDGVVIADSGFEDSESESENDVKSLILGVLGTIEGVEY